MVSERNEIKTRRYWRPNVQQKRLWSPSLKKFIRLRITTRVLRTVDKCGGLDEYLLGERPARIKELGMGGWMLRWRIMQTDSYKERLRKTWEAYGLPPPQELLASDLPTSVQQELVAKEVRGIDTIIADESEDGWIDIGEDLDSEVDMGEQIGEELLANQVEDERFMEEKLATGGKAIL
jgi:large subunit ribosomal protein L28